MKFLKLFENFNSQKVIKSRDIKFTKVAFQQFNEWRFVDKQIQDKIIKLIEDILRDPFTGLGKPEPLGRGQQSKKFGTIQKGQWSRRISDEHRLVYEVFDADIRITACKGHYDDK